MLLPRMPAPLLACAACAALLLPSRAGTADPAPFTIGTKPAWFALGGLSTGVTFAGTDDIGAAIGGELSVARLRDQRFVGGYLEGLYDFALDSATVGGGLELGWKVLAVDVGALARRLDDPQLAVSGRLCASVGLFSLCGRYARFDASEDRDVVQVGLLLKLPLFSPSGGY
jgi:hypothetical protein